MGLLLPRSNHLDRSGIGGKAFVRRDQRHGLGDRLRDEHPVERVGVNGRKARELHGVLRRDGKLVKSICLQRITDCRGVGYEILPAPRGLDRDLPQARGAVEELMAPVAEEARYAGRQLPGSVHVPEQQLRIHQESAHLRFRPVAVGGTPVNSAAISSSNIVLKSSGIGAPFKPPIFTGLRASSIGTRRAAGPPALARTISSPACTRSTRRGKCVLPFLLLFGFLETNQSYPSGVRAPPQGKERAPPGPPPPRRRAVG